MPLRQPGIFGQMTWDTYTVVLLGFRTSKPHNVVLDALDTAAQRLTSAFPFLAGQIVLEGRTATSSGTYSIAPYSPHDGKSLITRKDCTTICPNFEEMDTAQAPFSMLPGDVLSPTKGMGNVYDYSETRPVLLTQANIVHGGVLLCFSSHHNTLDMNGQGQMIKFFAAACRGEDFSTSDLEIGNMDEHHFLKLLGDGEQLASLDHMRRASTLNPLPPPQTNGEREDGVGQKPSWRYWRFPASNLTKLKNLATPERSSDTSEQQWISTNDALVAFYVQRLTALRLQSPKSHVENDTPIGVNRAADGRSKVSPPVPASYMGHMVVASQTDFSSASDLVSAPLCEVALAFRKSLNALDDNLVRSLATALSKTDDKTTIFYGAHHVPGQNLMITSWAGLGLYSTDFGDVFGKENGKPVFVRRPDLTEVPDMVYVMPKAEGGGIDFGCCLREEEWEMLRGDEGWLRYVEEIG